MRRLICRAVAWGVIAVALVLSVASAGAGELKMGKGEDYDPVINPADFEDGGGNPLPIDNQYWPLVPGTTFFYESTDGEETNEVYVTHDTKDILGVTCTVVLDQEWEEGELVEKTYDWYAQDVHGDIWYFGEYSEQWEDGVVVGTEGSWEAGVDGAKAGILMLGDPHPGDSYRQEYWEDEAEDMAKVLRLNATVSGPSGYHENCLETKEWSPLDAGNVEHKFYAPGVGLVLVKELKGKTLHVELIEVTTE